jgi:sugar lactone lactonase YvrE
VGDAYGVTFLPDGNLAVGDFGGTIYQVTPGGDVFTVATGLDAQYSVISDSGGNIFSASFGAGTVTEIAANGTTSTFASGLGGDLTDMAFDANGNLYVSDYGGGIIDEITPGGDVSTFATGLGGPTGLAFGLSGNLYVAGYGDGTIVQITPDGSTITPVASGLNQPEGIVFAPEPSVGPLAAGLAALLWVARRKFVRQ